MLADRISYARKESGNDDLLLAFLADEFTLGQAQSAMSALKGEHVDKSNFRQYIKKYVEDTGEVLPMTTRPTAIYWRKGLYPSEDVPLSASGISEIRELAKDYRIRNLDLFLAGMSKAPESAVQMLRQIIMKYAQHRDYLLKSTRVPDLRIDDERYQRVLVTIKWQLQKQNFLCTALAPVDKLSEFHLLDLRDWKTGPHKSTFRITSSNDDFDRLGDVLKKSADLLN